MKPLPHILTLFACLCCFIQPAVSQSRSGYIRDHIPRIEFRLAEQQPGKGLVAANVVGTDRQIFLHPKKEITNRDIASATVGEDTTMGPSVMVTFTRNGAGKLTRLTSRNVGKLLAILVDGNVVSAPVIRDPITGGKATITGEMSLDEAERMAWALSRQR